MKKYYITFDHNSPRADKYIEIDANDDLQVVKWLRIEYPTEIGARINLFIEEQQYLTLHRKVVVGFDSKYANENLEAHQKQINNSRSTSLIELMTGDKPDIMIGDIWEQEQPERFKNEALGRKIDAAHSSLIIPLD